ncbi:hypothetical protein PMIN01_10281 [Paraphaeosphaeria minitans]|uniref:Uncharacterized protein n=1 Tax=Paraphaeosphaeria minitans TaxID=565426 RepID=A0A9P6G9F0_9PLEO|nr:hypothetical protein PMIN01_10281 [Paraphaeosphaeria minitans]
MPGVAGSPIPGKAACTVSKRSSGQPLPQRGHWTRASGKRVQFVPLGRGDERGVTLLLAVGDTWAPLSSAVCRCRARGRRPHLHAPSAWSKRGRGRVPLPSSVSRAQCSAVGGEHGASQQPNDAGTGSSIAATHSGAQ